MVMKEKKRIFKEKEERTNLKERESVMHVKQNWHNMSLFGYSELVIYFIFLYFIIS